MQLLPLTTEHDIIKNQKTYDAEKKKIQDFFRKLHSVIFFPNTCIPGAVNKMVFNSDKLLYELKPDSPDIEAPSRARIQAIKNLDGAIKFLDDFPDAKYSLQEYLDNWNESCFEILVGGTIDFSEHIARLICREMSLIICDLKKSYPERCISTKDINRDELRAEAIHNIQTNSSHIFCDYTQLAAICFGQASGTVPGKRFSKGHIYNPHPITVAPIKKKRTRKKKE